MPVTPTYPGIYIEELPSSARTITAAPTSITVFVGYTHPFKTNHFGEAVRIFNFTEYEREFGGHFVSGAIPSAVPKAVEQFFLNGGSDAYVVGIEAGGGATAGTLPIPLTGDGIVFTAREPTDLIAMTVTIDNLDDTSTTGDITITYGTRVETFRQVSTDPTSDRYIETVIGVVDDEKSSLVTVAPSGGTYALTKGTGTLTGSFGSPSSPISADFSSVFANDQSLDKVPIFNLLVMPGIDDSTIVSRALAFCERKRAFAILDPQESAVPEDSGTNSMALLMGTVPKSINGAIYFPYLKSLNPVTGDPEDVPPSGFVAGVYARTDLNRGVWKAPAGLETTLLGTTGVADSGRMTDQRQGTLNVIGVNCLRSFPGIGTVVYGARTLRGSDTDTAFQQWKYVPVRRMALFIEQTLYRNLGWVVFEPNDEPLWAAIRTNIEGFMLSLFNQGAFQGSTPSQAFQVKCDKSTTTQTDIDNGIVNIIVAFAPLKPAEFVIIKIAQLAGQVQS